MRRFVFIIISSCAMLFASAQEEIVLDSIPEIRRGVDAGEISMDRPLFFDDSFSLKTFNLFDQSAFNKPLLHDYRKNLVFNLPQDSSGISSETFSGTLFGISPFFSSGTIFNQAIYKVNDHFSFGGNSFGAQSVFDQPQINQTIQEMSIKGASMFMQYKFSGNFRVETRVSISNQRSPWEP